MGRRLYGAYSGTVVYTTVPLSLYVLLPQVCYRKGIILTMEAIIHGFQLFQQGGPVMYLLLACSLFAVYIGIERAIFFAQMDAGKAFANKFYTYMKFHKAAQAKQLAADSNGGLPPILNDVFEGQGGAEWKAFIEMQSGIFISRLRSHLYYLSVIVTLAPLLGLLGTISGMIRSFSIFNVQSGQAIAITGGIGEALIATAFGLCVAILALVIHSYFTQRLDRIITDMELCFSALETMDQKEGQ